MPRGVPGTFNEARESLRERIKEMEERLKHYDRREKMFGDLKKWMASRKLDATDLWWMLRQMKPTRPQGKPVRSKKPLKPFGYKKQANGTFMMDGKVVKAKGDPEFRRAIHAARIERKLTAEFLGKKIGSSSASITSWECGRYVPKEALRAKLVKELGLPATLGQAASLAMERRQGQHTNGG